MEHMPHEKSFSKIIMQHATDRQPKSTIHLLFGLHICFEALNFKDIHE